MFCLLDVFVLVAPHSDNLQFYQVFQMLQLKIQKVARLAREGSPCNFKKGLIKQCQEFAQGAPGAFSIIFCKDLVDKCQGIGPMSSRRIFHQFSKKIKEGRLKELAQETSELQETPTPS